MIRRRLKEWETRFFGRSLFALELEGPVGYADLPALRLALDEILESADAGVYEFELDARFLFVAPVLEDAGFRLWDSKYRFVTRIDRAALPVYSYDLPSAASIRSYDDDDRDAVLDLNSRYLVGDDQLVSKFKSPHFDATATERWFAAWVENSLADGAHCAILDGGESVDGFFIYARRGEHRGLPLFKGILCSIVPELRGRNLHLALQEHILHHQIAEESFYLDNTTQISNLPIIRNHASSGRRPQSVQLLFLLEIAPR